MEHLGLIKPPYVYNLFYMFSKLLNGESEHFASEKFLPNKSTKEHRDQYICGKGGDIGPELILWMLINIWAHWGRSHGEIHGEIPRNCRVFSTCQFPCLCLINGEIHGKIQIMCEIMVKTCF